MRFPQVPPANVTQVTAVALSSGYNHSAAVRYPEPSSSMQQPVEAPTPKALADLIARCDQINRRFETQLHSSRSHPYQRAGVGHPCHAPSARPQGAGFGKAPDAPGAHSTLGAHRRASPRSGNTADQCREEPTSCSTSTNRSKSCADRSWRGQWRSVTLWHNKENGVTAAQVMEFLARLTSLAHKRAPDVARGLLARSEAVVSALELVSQTPRGRNSGPTTAPERS